MTRANAESDIDRKYCKPDMTVIERLNHVGWTVTPTGCWEWNGGKHVGGYGVLNIHGRSAYAHREALQISLGRKLGPNMFACHTCDNPPCMNPAHLFEGTAQDNNRDAKMKGRLSGGRTGNKLPSAFPRETFNLVASMSSRGYKPKEIREATGLSMSYVYSLLNGQRRPPNAYRQEVNSK